MTRQDETSPREVEGDDGDRPGRGKRLSLLDDSQTAKIMIAITAAVFVLGLALLLVGNLAKAD